jgi:hypothetical protein
VSTVFKGETLRSMLLYACGWWKVSQIVYIVSLVLFGLGAMAGLRRACSPSAAGPGAPASPRRAYLASSGAACSRRGSR